LEQEVFLSLRKEYAMQATEWDQSQNAIMKNISGTSQAYTSALSHNEKNLKKMRDAFKYEERWDAYKEDWEKPIAKTADVVADIGVVFTQTAGLFTGFPKAIGCVVTISCKAIKYSTTPIIWMAIRIEDLWNYLKKKNE
jgi:hypothetical protein